MPTCSVRGVVWRFLLLFLSWILFGFFTSAHLCILSQMSPVHRKSLCLQIIVNVAGLLLLLGGGALVVGNRDGGNRQSNYVPCPNNVTMDRHCMYQLQPLSYLFPYIIHYIGGGYCLVGWFLDMCHLLPWAIQASSQYNATRERNIPMKNLDNAPAADAEPSPSLSPPPCQLTLFCTVVPPPHERQDDHTTQRCSVSFNSYWHVGSKFMILIIVTMTWMVFVNWSTEPKWSSNVTYTGAANPYTYVSLGGLLGIIWLEVVCIFGVVSAMLRSRRVVGCCREWFCREKNN